MLKKLIKKYQQNAFNKVAKNIRATKPIENIHNELVQVIVVSQIYHNAVDMALIALKSFIQHLGMSCNVELLDDGSLTVEDYQLFKTHLPNCNISKISDVDLGGCPQGGCWERLVKILQLTETAYVIQVDTDTLTLNDLPEIQASVKNNTAFTIGTNKWSEPVTAKYMAETARGWNNNHIQAKAESVLDSVESITIEKYLRGCAAFTGFPMGCDLLRDLHLFSAEMERKLGYDSWREWGTEQFSSNVMVSFCPASIVLPWPSYQNFMFPEISHFKPETYKVIHFIGSNRYASGVYRELIKRYIFSYNNSF